MRVTHLFNDLRYDLLYGLRQLRQAPTFSVLALLTLGIGIGINTGLFSIINGVLFTNLPVRDPEELRQIEWSYRVRPGFRNAGTQALSYPTYQHLRQETTSFSELLCLSTGPLVSAPIINVSIRGNSQRATAQFVSGNFFRALGVTSAIGRGLSPEDEENDTAAVLTYGAWQRLFGGDPNVLGQSITVNRSSLTIVGVTPKEFYFDTNNDRQGQDFILPMSRYAAVTGIADGLTHARTPCRVVGRLRPGVSDEQARVESENLIRQAFLANPFKGVTSERFQELDQRGRDTAELPPQVGLRGMARVVDALTWREIRADILPAVLAGMFLPWAILIIPCSNIASLLLARTAVRRAEIATRLAMGASRQRLVRQLLTESVLLACLGGVLGILICNFLGQFFSALEIPFLLDVRVLALTAGLAVVTGIVFGLVPALSASRLDLLSATKQGAGGSLGGSSFRTGKGLITVQVTLAALVLIGAGLEVRSLIDLVPTSASEPEQVLVLQVDPNPNQSDPATAATYFQEVTRLMDGLPGVVSTSLSTEDRAVNDGGLHIVGVGPRFFETMKIPLIRGRETEWSDRQGAANVAIVNEAYVREFHSGVEPMGQAVPLGTGAKRTQTARELGQIVGVVADSNNAVGEGIQYGQGIEPTIYVPFQQQNSGPMMLVLRIAGATTPLIPSIRRVVTELDRNAIIGPVQTQAQLVSSYARPRRIGVVVFLVFGLVALLQASLGIYGTLSYFVNRRIPEIGLRMALGAGRTNVTRMVIRQSLIPVGLGILLGLVGAPAVTFAMQSAGDDPLVGNITANDPVAIISALLFLATVATIAALGPAWRASRIDPMKALRNE